MYEAVELCRSSGQDLGSAVREALMEAKAPEAQSLAMQDMDAVSYLGDNRLTCETALRVLARRPVTVPHRDASAARWLVRVRG